MDKLRRASDAGADIGPDELLLPLRPGLASQSWDDDEALLMACAQLPSSTPPLLTTTSPSIPPPMPSLYDLLPPQELLWTAPIWQPSTMPRPFDATPSQPSLPTVRSFPSLASRQRTSLEESTVFWDDYVRGGPLIRSRSLRTDPPFLAELPIVAPQQQQQQHALLDMLAAQPGSVPIRPSMVTNTHLREVFLSTAEVQDLERLEASRPPLPLAPAPPPTPVHSNLANVFGTSDDATVEGMDTDMIMEQMDHAVPLTFPMPEDGNNGWAAEQPSSTPLMLPPPISTSGGHAGDHNTASSPTAEMAAASRARCLERLRHKKLHRRFGNHHIRYEQRKVNADKRPRFKGRFVKAAPEEPCSEPPQGGIT